jgi:hypothetical protein
VQLKITKRVLARNGSAAIARILYQDAAGPGSEVQWDGEHAEVIASRGTAYLIGKTFSNRILGFTSE